MGDIDPNLIAIGLFALGFIAARWEKNANQHTKAVQVDADVLARLAHVENWQRDHNSIHGCVQRLTATSEGMAKNFDRLSRRIDLFMSSFPAPRTPANRSPFDFRAPRDWIEPGEDDEART